jgi:hypothetical protein
MKNRYRWRHRAFSLVVVIALLGTIQIAVTLREPTTAGPALLKAARAEAATCGPNDVGCKLYNGQAGIVQDTPTPIFSPNMTGHGETTTILWNGQWLMYYRTFVRPDDSRKCGFPTGIALAKSSDGGATWQAQNGGKPLPTLQSVMPGGCAEATNITATELYAPDVIVDGSKLLMVFERRDTDTSGARCAVGRACISVWYATSTAAGGDVWGQQHRLLAPGAVGAWDDEVGTPDIELYGSPRYVLTFHGHDATNHITPYYQRGYLKFNTLGDNLPGRAKITVALPGWANQGIGISDMRKESNGQWYAVFEAYSGTDYRCGQPTAKTAVGIAQSSDVATWTIRNGPLLRGGLNTTSCGWDVPAFQLIAGRSTIVTNDDAPPEQMFRRWRIQSDPAPTRWSAGGSVLPRNTYLAAGDRLTAGPYQLVMQDDGNLVLYGGSAIWASDTDKQCPGPQATMQTDGNFVLYCNGAAKQATGTDGHPGAALFLHSDGPWVLSAQGKDFYATAGNSPHRLEGGCIQQC